MKGILLCSVALLIAVIGKSQKVYDPCQKLDTNKIKQLILGTWIDIKDTSHVLTFTEDSLTERILIDNNGVKKINMSYWSYKFTDNIFSSDAVTCYSLYEYKEGYSHHTDFPVNGIDNNFLLLGSTGKNAYKRKQ